MSHGAIRFGPRIVDLVREAWQPSWRQAVIICDSNTSALFGRALAAALRPLVSSVLTLSFAAGEASKTRESKARLEDEMLARGVDRSCCVVAVGGGVVTDLAGFIAATYMRGVPYINVATTLLAQVDAAIGGKTAINSAAGKNCIGAYHQPRAVLLPAEALDTLAPRELRDGLSEAIKLAVVADGELFDRLERWSHAGVLRPPGDLVVRCARLKAQIVARDERDDGLRQILNFGHTVGHAIEAASGMRVRHGQAVAAGMLVEARLAEDLANFPPPDTRRLYALLTRLALDLRPQCSFDDAWPFFAADKKCRDGVVQVVAPRGIGRVHGASVVPLSLSALAANWSS